MKFRNWGAVAAWFRRGGPMHHRTAPRGGADTDPEIISGLEEYQTEEARRAAELAFQATPEELGRAAVAQCKRKHQDNQPENQGEPLDRPKETP